MGRTSTRREARSNPIVTLLEVGSRARNSFMERDFSTARSLCGALLPDGSGGGSAIAMRRGVEAELRQLRQRAPFRGAAPLEESMSAPRFVASGLLALTFAVVFAGPAVATSIVNNDGAVVIADVLRVAITLARCGSGSRRFGKCLGKWFQCDGDCGGAASAQGQQESAAAQICRGGGRLLMV